MVLQAAQTGSRERGTFPANTEEQAQLFSSSRFGWVQLVAFINCVAVGYLYLELFFIFGIISLRETPGSNVTESEVVALSIADQY